MDAYDSSIEIKNATIAPTLAEKVAKLEARVAHLETCLKASHELKPAFKDCLSKENE